MKKDNPHRRYAFGTCLILAILLVTALAAVGQEKTIEKADFEKMVSDGYKALAGKTYRLKYTSEAFKNGKIVPDAVLNVVIFETLPPDRIREIRITKMQDVEMKTERITIGSQEWIRKDDGPWSTKMSEIEKKWPGFKEELKMVESYRNLGKTKLSGVNVAIYEKVEKVEYDIDSQTETAISTDRYWIDESGLIRQSVCESGRVSTKRLRRETTVYEYDAKITIEAPIK